MSSFMRKRFVGSGGKGSQKGPQKGPGMVLNSGEDSDRETKRMLRPTKPGILVVFVAITALDPFYILSENEMVVLTTFGRSSSVMTSGPKFRYPFIQRVYKMSREIKGMPIGYDSDYNTEYPTDSENNPVSLPSESEVIARDFNFVNTDFYTKYQTVDPIKAYIDNDTAISILRNLAQSYIRSTMGSHSVDEVTTMGKSEMQTKVKSLLPEHLEQEDIEVGIVNVTIQDAKPPIEAANDTSKAVGDVKQGIDTKINEVKKHQSEQLLAASVKADKAARDTEVYRRQCISEVEGQVSHFNDMYEEYAKYPLIAKKRMFCKIVEELLPTLKVIVNGSDGTQVMLPLDSFVSENQNGGAW